MGTATTRIQSSTSRPIDRSGTVTLGGTAQVLMAQNAGRVGFWIQNTSDADLWINEVGTATAASPSYKLVAGAYYESHVAGCPVTAISIIGPTTGKAFSCREW